MHEYHRRGKSYPSATRKMVFIARAIHPLSSKQSDYSLEHSENCNFYYPLELPADEDVRRATKSYGLNLHQNPITFTKSCTSVLMVNCDTFRIIKSNLFCFRGCLESSRGEMWKANKSVTKLSRERMQGFIVMANTFLC
jgi:hypothetical protein